MLVQDNDLVALGPIPVIVFSTMVYPTAVESVAGSKLPPLWREQAAAKLSTWAGGNCPCATCHSEERLRTCGLGCVLCYSLPCKALGFLVLPGSTCPVGP